ncbi:elongation factor P [Candidatus Peregrinibacteria bacterium]|nr:elongation factor P [Candidatus Peregrinibacteria bacterium]
MDSQKIRAGAKILISDDPYVVMSYVHSHMSQSVGKMVVRARNLLTGNVLEKTFFSGENVPEADITMNSAQFLYGHGDEYSFMDNQTYEQFTFDKKKLGDVVDFLTEGLEVKVMNWNGNPINIAPPSVVNLKVVETEPGVRGDTASGGSKPAKLETGMVVQVPFFINTDDVLEINTESRSYKSRA